MTEKWYSGTVDAIADTFGTNTAAGLSPKAARARRRKEGDNDVFAVPHVSPLTYVAYVCSDVSMLLLILTAVLAAIWGHGVSGAAIFGIIALHSAAAIYTYVKSRRVLESMAVCTMPRVRVLRGGRVYAVDARMLVRGDVILLRPGDVIPCDARLCSSRALSVLQYSGRMGGKPQRGRVEKDAESGFPDSASPSLSEMKNMVFAGSVVLSGEGRAIAVEMGTNTFMVSAEGKIPLAAARDKMTALESLSKHCGRSALVMLLFILPLTVLGILIPDSPLNLLDYFLLALSLAVSSMSELTAAIGYVIVASGLLRSARGNAYTRAAASEDTAIIPHAEDLSALARTDTLVLFDHLALTEGKTVLLAAHYGRERLSLDGAEATMRRLLETALITAGLPGGASLAGDAEEDSSVKALLEFAGAQGVSADALRQTVRLIAFSGADAVNPFSCALIREENAPIALCSGDAASLLSRCTRIVDASAIGGSSRLSDEEKNKILTECAAETASGGYAIAYARRSSPYNTLQRMSALMEEMTLVGILVFGDPISPLIPVAIGELADAGVRTILMADRPTGVGGAEAFARAAGIQKNGIVCRAPEPISDDAELCIGYSGEERLAYIERLRSSGHTVIGLGSDVRHMRDLQSCTVSATCSPVSPSDRRENRLLDSLDPTAENYYGAEVLKRTAGLLIRRPGKTGGGIAAVLRAIRNARRIEINLAAALRCLLSAQTVRVFLLVLLLLLRIPALSALQLLISGLVLDFGTLIVCAFDRGPSKGVLPSDFFSRPFRACLPYVLLGVFCGAGNAAIAFLLRHLGILVGMGQISAFVFLSLVLTQTVLFFVCRPDTAHFGGSRIGLLWPICMLFFVVICCLSPAASVALGMELLPSYAGFSLLASPILAAIGGALIRVFTSEEEDRDADDFA